jgi:hypothetical protein
MTIFELNEMAGVLMEPVVMPLTNPWSDVLNGSLAAGNPFTGLDCPH